MDIERLLLRAGLTSLVLGLLLGPVLIVHLKRLRVGQTVRDDGPSTHLSKTGTPTMGGLIFLIPVVVSLLLWIPFDQLQPLLVWLWLLLGFGVIGFVDDYLKVVKKRSLGLRAREKLLGELLVGTLFFFMLRYLGVPDHLTVPVVGWQISLGWLYWPFVVFVSIAEANAVNLTDGVDGLCGTSFLITSVAYLFIGWIKDVPVVSLTAAAMIGGLLAYLRFNWHPAKVFMGDVGSLALGGALTCWAVLTKTELLLIPIGVVYLLETLSDVIQVTYFKLTGGRRVFRMAPIHHHFELGGWSEVKIVAVWSILSVAGGIIGLLILA
ncbi:MAG: phospho-N-acetylmuramoyl-pentapeptide-transferase [Bacillota bacterium]